MKTDEIDATVLDFEQGKNLEKFSVSGKSRMLSFAEKLNHGLKLARIL